MWRTRSEKACTLTGLFVVAVIIALFGSAGCLTTVAAAESRNMAAVLQIRSFSDALKLFKLDTGDFPSTAQGLKALRQKPEKVKNWRGPYLTKEIGMDPWGNPYIYRYPGEHGDEPDIISYGADGRPGGEGINADIVSWKNN